MTRMVDIGGKRVVKRTAIAGGYLVLKESTLKAIVKNDVKKGDVFSASKLAGIQAAKATSTILPLCHQIPLTSVELDISVLKGKVRARCTVSAEYKTGVEMEALVGVAASLLNVWDMVKYLEKNERGQYPTARMMDVRVLRKTKGGSRE
jgi:cyclic pyranopterin phosphate synthase